MFFSGLQDNMLSCNCKITLSSFVILELLGKYNSLICQVSELPSVSIKIYSIKPVISGIC